MLESKTRAVFCTPKPNKENDYGTTARKVYQRAKRRNPSFDEGGHSLFFGCLYHEEEMNDMMLIAVDTLRA